MQQASCLEGGPLLWIRPLYLHVNQKSDDDDDDDDEKGVKRKIKEQYKEEQRGEWPFSMPLHSKSLSTHTSYTNLLFCTVAEKFFIEKKLLY